MAMDYGIPKVHLLIVLIFCQDALIQSRHSNQFSLMEFLLWWVKTFLLGKKYFELSAFEQSQSSRVGLKFRISRTYLSKLVSQIFGQRSTGGKLLHFLNKHNAGLTKFVNDLGK